MSLSLTTLLVVLTLIAVRRLGRLRLAIWQIMGAGAFVVLAGGAIGPAAAWGAIDWEVMGFLFGVFVVGQATVESGVLEAFSARWLGRCRSADGLLLAWIFGNGLASALLMNDTLAVIGTPLGIALARLHRLPPVLLLLALAFAVTTGSVLSPIGNPQNLLIALGGGMSSPFLTFFGGLWLPTLLGLLLCYAVLRRGYAAHFAGRPLGGHPWPVVEPRLARLTRLAIGLLLAGILVRVAMAFWWPDLHGGLAWIALLAAAPLLLFAPHRGRLLRGIDWPTLFFFIALFVLMASVWASPEVQGWIAAGEAGGTPIAIYLLALGLSQILSNVPLVSLYLPWLVAGGGADTAALLALAAGSTLAGNLLIIGAASNVIIVQRAERQGVHIGFFEFARLGIPLTLLQSVVFLLWLL
jgi:Na+/H+ antiporter NhaD/arsenite permease-like protein